MSGLLLAQVDPSQAVGGGGLTWQQFGAFGLVCVVLVAVIGALVRDRTRMQAELASERAKKEDLHDKLLAQSEKLIPIAEHLGSVTEAATKIVIQAESARR